MNEKNRDIWFPAKKYGIGWGFPISWQGWAVFLGYIALVLVGAVLLIAFKTPILLVPFVIYVLILSGFLFLICYKKGEKIDFRWGNK